MVPSLSVSAAMTFWHFTRGFPNDRRPGASLKLQYLLFLVVSGPILFSQAGDVWKLRLALAQPPVKTPAHITADYLNSVRQASDTLFVWDYLPEIYFLTGMSSSVRVLTALYISLSPQGHERFGGERKSTRLNSSHGYISYAVFCLKKKNITGPWGTARSARRDGT